MVVGSWYPVRTEPSDTVITGPTSGNLALESGHFLTTGEEAKISLTLLKRGWTKKFRFLILSGEGGGYRPCEVRRETILPVIFVICLKTHFRCFPYHETIELRNGSYTLYMA